MVFEFFNSVMLYTILLNHPAHAERWRRELGYSNQARHKNTKLVESKDKTVWWSFPLEGVGVGKLVPSRSPGKQTFSLEYLEDFVVYLTPGVIDERFLQ